MKHIAILRIFVVMMMMVFSLSASAQQPMIMDYQIMATHPVTGEVLANKKINVRIELRLNAEDGETIWSKEETLTSSKAGICTLKLDFSEVDFTLGTYFIKAFIDNKQVGTSQINHVPFAIIADYVSGVITKSNLIGTWVCMLEGHKFTFVFNQDGSFTYTEEGDYDDYHSGTWELNNLGYIIFNNVNDSRMKKQVLPTVYDKKDKGLWITGSDHTFFYEQLMFYKLK